MIQLNDRSIFLSICGILFIYNVAYLLNRPPVEQTALIEQMLFGGVVAMIVTVGGIAIIAGTTIVGSGLNSESIRILFGIGTILNLLFQIPLGTFSVGIGLVNPVFALFLNSGSGFLAFIGFIVATGLALAALISGLMMITG